MTTFAVGASPEGIDRVLSCDSEENDIGSYLSRCMANVCFCADALFVNAQCSPCNMGRQLTSTVPTTAEVELRYELRARCLC